ncbi:hypothetical protein F8154_10925 [Alkaliphilus pronyensis]|uniref:Methyl-accepting transducer domain-containing protein n=1 Tax=Alkaliphilus pronyensis TaxID=1482732 RepID=A0A6I0FE26_9FIRM|nr:methyl-accepting chemotaxis protein [Alkaliphilus pronyensis]KAB3533280.1 hypothetical protein F8154_10925 [Alkaliphilus pronyensis]
MLKTLDAFIKVAPLMNQLHGRDMAVAICDTENYIAYCSGEKLSFPVKPGDKVKEGAAIYQAMKLKKRVVRNMGKELFGFPYIAIAIPIEEEGRIIGGVCFLESIEQQSLLLGMAETLHNEITQLQASTQEIEAQSQQLMSAGVGLVEAVEKVKSDTDASQNITLMIKKISDQTNLLGLNASIEAARLGELGRGFNVVAGEIRKLALSTKESTDKIDSIVKGLKNNSQWMDEKATSVEDAAKAQVSSIEQIREGIQLLYGLIEKMRAEAENIVK